MNGVHERDLPMDAPQGGGTIGSADGPAVSGSGWDVFGGARNLPPW